MLRKAFRVTGCRATAVALLVVLAVAGCGGGGDGQSSAQGGGVRTIVPVEQRKEPVDLAGTTLAGTRLDLATLRGKPVVLNIWGSWCAPCRKEAPELQAAAAELAGKAAFVGIATRDDEAGAKAYERRFKVTYPSFLDGGDMLLQLRGAVSSQSPPVTLVLDAKGRVAARFIGVVTRRSLVGAVEDVTKSA
jgi:thiol-disulfide isomerase/thioredoxin